MYRIDVMNQTYNERGYVISKSMVRKINLTVKFSQDKEINTLICA